MTKITCTKSCPSGSYSFKLRRCERGMIRPPSIKAGVETARIMGIDYICYYGGLRDKVWQRAIDELGKELENGKVDS